MNGLKGDFVIGRCFSNKYVMERKVVANGILKGEKDNRLLGILVLEILFLVF